MDTYELIKTFTDELFASNDRSIEIDNVRWQFTKIYFNLEYFKVETIDNEKVRVTLK